MDARSVRLAQMNPAHFDPLLPVTQRPTVLALPALQAGPYRLTLQQIPAGERIEMLSRGGWVRYDDVITIRTLWHAQQVLMSDSPSELADMAALVQDARPGHCLLAGLGLGLLATLVAQKAGVTAVTVVERAPEIIQLIGPYLPPQVTVIQADFHEWLPAALQDRYSSVLLDIWGDLSLDLLPAMLGLWRAVRQRLGPVTGNIWGYDFLRGQLGDAVQGDAFPSQTAHTLRQLDLGEAATWLERLYPDEDYDGTSYYGCAEDEAAAPPTASRQWGDDLDEALRDAFYHVYQLPTYC